MFSVRSMLVGAEHANWLDYLRMTGQYSVQDILSILAGALLAGMVISIVGLIILWGLIPRNKFIVWALLNMTSVSAAVFLYESLFQVPFLGVNSDVINMIGVIVGGALAGVPPSILLLRRTSLAFIWVAIGSCAWLLLLQMMRFFAVEDVP